MVEKDIFTKYKYELVEKDTVQIYFPKEYFFPTFLDTIEVLKKENFYNKVSHIILDLRRCKYLHGIGMSSEIQNFYADSKVENKNIYWVGNPGMHQMIETLMSEYFDEIVPFYSTIEEIKK